MESITNVGDSIVGNCYRRLNPKVDLVDQAHEISALELNLGGPKSGPSQ